MCRTSASDFFFSVRAPSPLLLDGNRCRSRARVRIRNETGLCGGGGLGLHFYVLKVLSVARNVFVIVFFSPSQTLSGGKSIPILKTANVSQIWYFKEEKRGEGENNNVVENSHSKSRKTGNGRDILARCRRSKNRQTCWGAPFVYASCSSSIFLINTV